MMRMIARHGTLPLGQLVRQDGDEDEVVDAQHDLHRDERNQGGPGGRIGGKRQQFVHGDIRWSVVASRRIPPSRYTGKRVTLSRRRLPA